MSTATTGLAAHTLGTAELRAVTRRLRETAHATISASTRTRELTAIAAVRGESFELLMPSDNGVRLINGPAGRLGAELVGLVGTLERLVGTAPLAKAPPAVDIPPLAPGELLALAEVIRRGDAERVEAACNELDLGGIPWWLTQLAWGAEALLTLRLTGSGIAGFTTMLHLLPDGWGCLQADVEDDLTFRPLTTIEVQARVNAFAALLLESS